eukprot:6191989-Pleurochrysis_carterae.AAC.1
MPPKEHFARQPTVSEAPSTTPRNKTLTRPPSPQQQCHNQVVDDEQEGLGEAGAGEQRFFCVYVPSELT